MRRRILYGVLVVAVAFSCVDPIKLQIESSAGSLVVDGMITNEKGPYTVKLSRSITFVYTRPLRVFANPEPGAKITISDGTFSEQLTETTSGTYVTKDLQGTIGNAYSMNITTKDGKTYTSQPELMLPVSTVDSLKYEFLVYDRLFINANGVPRIAKSEGFNITAIANDPKGRGNNYKWEVEGIYEFFSVSDFPDLRICWVNIPHVETTLQVSSDQYFEGQRFRQFLGVVPYDRPTRYMVKIKQWSLTQKALDYWNTAKAQQSSTGSLFDPPPTTANGNVKGTDGELTLGYFGVSALSRLNFLMNRFDASGHLPPSPNILPQAGDCRGHVPGATNVRPEGF